MPGLDRWGRRQCGEQLQCCLLQLPHDHPSQLANKGGALLSFLRPCLRQVRKTGIECSSDVVCSGERRHAGIHVSGPTRCVHHGASHARCVGLNPTKVRWKVYRLAGPKFVCAHSTNWKTSIYLTCWHTTGLHYQVVRVNNMGDPPPCLRSPPNGVVTTARLLLPFSSTFYAGGKGPEGP